MTDLDPNAPPAAPKPSWSQWIAASPWWRRMRLGCGALAVLAVALPIGIWQWTAYRASIREQQAEQAHAQKANDAFEPAMEALAEAVAQAQATPEVPYDID